MKKPSDMRDILPLWLIGQTELPKIVRWSKYVKANPKLRVQNTLEHSWALSILGAFILGKLKGFVRFDEGLILRAINIHDVSEGILQRDTLFADKTSEKDRDEYVAFAEEIKFLDAKIKKDFKRAFLLQFAHENPECFPAEARKIMTSLWKRQRNSVLLFQAIEILDYMMYAIEGYNRCGDKALLVQILRNQCPRLDRVADNLPRLREHVWTDSLRTFCINKITELSDVSTETKSVGT